MAIDKPTDAVEQQYLRDEERSPLELTVYTTRLAFPKAVLPLEIFRKVHERLTRPSVDERITVMWHTLVKEIEHLEATKANVDDVEEAIQLAMRYDAEQFNDKKRERYVTLIGNAMRSETEIRDVATFIRTIEQLNERDVAVLKVLNQVMNKDSDWKPQSNPGGDVWKVHPNVFIHRRQELALQVAIALGQPVEKNTFSRDEGYMICTRLQGFGLAHEVQPGARELPLTDYTFQLSTQGIRLLKLLGENVPNFDHYVRS